MPESVPENNGKEKTVLSKKILGTKIQYTRARSGLNIKEVAQALGVDENKLSDIEFGRREVTLPQLEVMAYLFNVPVMYFWSDSAFKEADLNFATLAAMELRRRIIGILLRQARTEAGRSEQDLAELLAVSANLIANYEFGKIDIPLPHLETLAKYLNVPLNYFMDKGIVPNETGGEVATLEEIAQFAQLPKEVRQFLTNSANLLYINIAMSLSDLSADTLRGMAEGLLEVTY